jgi:predicted dehydrogenase
MAKLNIGFIGAGGIASRHLGNLLAFSDVHIAALADPAVERAREQAARCPHAAQVYDDYRQMLDKEQLDALYICVPPFVHGGPELAAVERGIPFFVEKPLAADAETADTIGVRVAEAGLITAVGYHWRYLDTTEEARVLLDKNPARLALGYWLDGTPPPSWWHNQSQSGGQMVEQTTHIFDLARVLVGDVERVYAAGARTARPAFPDMDVCDVSAATLHFKSGALGQMASTCLLNWPHRVGLHLFCDAMAIELSEFEIMVDVGRGRPVRQAQGDPFVREDRDFIDAVVGKGNRIRAPYAEALRTHHLSTTASRSVREGRVLDVEDSLALSKG